MPLYQVIALASLILIYVLTVALLLTWATSVRNEARRRATYIRKEHK